jgi:hypothetical protein
METTMKKMKMSWPEVVGWHVMPAVSKIHADRPDLEIEVHRNGNRVPLEHNMKRVRVFTTTGGHDGIVARMPVVG